MPAPSHLFALEHIKTAIDKTSFHFELLIGNSAQYKKKKKNELTVFMMTAVSAETCLPFLGSLIWLEAERQDC